jgi:3-methyladenine DNA glycosylase/8-oxoguanine DNA glycosylase
MNITLTPASPFSLPAVVNSHGWVALPPFRRRDDGGFSYVTRLDSGRPLALDVYEEDGGLVVSTGDDLQAPEQEQIAEQVAWMVGLNQDLAPFYALVRDRPKLAHVAEDSKGRILRSPTLFEDVVKTILTTNTSWAGTIRMTQNLVSQLGVPLPGPNERCAFPTPEQVAAADETTLRRETGLGYRAPYVLELARSVAGGALDLEALKTMDVPTDELRRQLLDIKGVGNYAAANLLLLLGRYDYIPIDSWALRMVSNEWHDGQRIDPAQVEERFAHWGQWKGLAYWFWAWSE